MPQKVVFVDGGEVSLPDESLTANSFEQALAENKVIAISAGSGKSLWINPRMIVYVEDSPPRTPSAPIPQAGVSKWAG